MQTLKAIYGLKQSPRAWSKTEARVELLCEIMIWPEKKGKKELYRALFEEYWERSQKRAESDIHRNIEHPTTIDTAAHTSHSLSTKSD